MMAHCSPCKSKLGTGGRINAPVRAGGGGWSQASTGQREEELMLAWPTVRTGLRRRYMQLASMQRVTPQQWISAISSIGDTPPFYPYALYTGGKYALLFADRTSAKRRVLEVRNGGPTGLQVRLGQIVGLEAGFGTGCNTCVGTGARVQPAYDPQVVYGVGSGADVQRIALERGVSPNECQVIFYDGQGYMCCGSDCVPLPVVSDERSLFIPTTYSSGARPRYRRHW